MQQVLTYHRDYEHETTGTITCGAENLVCVLFQVCEKTFWLEWRGLTQRLASACRCCLSFLCLCFLHGVFSPELGIGTASGSFRLGGCASSGPDVGTGASLPRAAIRLGCSRRAAPSPGVGTGAGLPRFASLVASGLVWNLEALGLLSIRLGCSRRAGLGVRR
jgi:hypothetical protein